MEKTHFIPGQCQDMDSDDAVQGCRTRYAAPDLTEFEVNSKS